MTPFTQDDYNEIVYALDKAMLAIRGLGKSEPEAQSMLKDFVDQHYFGVWRKIVDRLVTERLMPAVAQNESGDRDIAISAGATGRGSAAPPAGIRRAFSSKPNTEPKL